MPDVQTKRPTLRDVANLAGVSYQTVSRVVNEHPHVANPTREKVLSAIRELDYHPNRAAQVLMTGRSYTLQLILFDNLWDPIMSMLHWSRVWGYTMAVAEARDSLSVSSVRKVVEEFVSYMVDGLVLVVPYPHLSYEVLCEICQDTPFVLLGTEFGSKMPSVVFDQRYGTELAITHLLGLGHRCIAEIRGPLLNFDACARHRTLNSMLKSRNIAPGPVVESDFTVAGGYRAAQQLINSGERFTAIFAGNDKMALGAMRALCEHNLRVPMDVSIVGFDDMDEAAYLDPPLTTVRQDFDALGKQCIEYLVSLIEDTDTPVQQRVLYPELIVRHSTRRIQEVG
ncbi:MAG: LacI family DNA-binding transcriptional regulator [Anaerolineae bacterium]|nr:LacI family DNA-binding transcriptional regulator [Anaerolineae bacterium]